ncbi:hypothetical protein GF351_03880 [Candidatus Woesearchaeota archaeon]|nr:hypothetical protein [Candidatus Woesearchaeota archaeon]
MLHMSQKYYIIQSLLRKPNHIRGLAKELHTNQTTIARKMQELLESNVVDFHHEGRNKVFTLKKTFEAKQHACISEILKAQEIIEKHPKLRMIFESTRKNSNVHLAILFGSYAKGSPTKDSDIDIFIESKDKQLAKEIRMIDSRISLKTGRYDRSSLLIKEIEKNHVIIKGVEEYQEKNSFFA